MKEKHSYNFWSLAAGKLFRELEEKENEQLTQLLMQEENKANYQRLASIYKKLPHTKPLNNFESARSWAAVDRILKKKRIRFFLSAAKYAAIIFLAFSFGSLLNINWNKQQEPIQYTEINVPLGQMSDITLSDGSRVWLNSGTKMRYPDKFGKDSRNISLEGEAFFKVKHKKIPFKVKLKNSEVEVLGTSFNVVSFSEDDFSQVTLIAGLVKMNTMGGEEIASIKPSQQITISNDLKDISLKTVNTNFYKSWTEGKIVFREERLADIIPRLERWYNVDIRYLESTVGELCFSGTILKNKPFDQIVKAFELLLPVNIDYRHNLDNKDVITISKKMCL